jgi:hypothetical protein
MNNRQIEEACRYGLTKEVEFLKAELRIAHKALERVLVGTGFTVEEEIEAARKESK